MTDTATASPRPWRVVYARVLDAEGKTVCVCDKDSMHGRADDETAKADAALIVEAVNERDRLRDLVKRMAAYIQVGAIGGALLREARAAIGEEANRA